MHAGTDLASIQANLAQYAVEVRDQVQTSHGIDSLGVGLWIPDEASRQLVGGQLDAFQSFLAANRLTPFTINGFPFANFHGDHVKQNVYLPTWSDVDRLEYTKRLAKILASLLPKDQTLGSISTLPIGWPNNPFVQPPNREINIATAGDHFRQLVKFLDSLERDTGKRIVVAIEPEPGCTLDTADDIADFFDKQLPDSQHRRYITVCHDICHSAVMNEPQREAITHYQQAGITIGKVQVSSAIVADWQSIPRDRYEEAINQLNAFAEDRYLHQTGQIDSDGDFALATDLPELLARTSAETLDQSERWVIHFHVPIFLDQFGLLGTSRDDVVECLSALHDQQINAEFTGHLEVETYAWTVLPEAMRQGGLAGDIAREMQWLLDQLNQ